MAQKIVINNTGSTPKSYINESKTTLVNVKDLDKILQAIAGFGLKYQISNNTLEVDLDDIGGVDGVVTTKGTQTLENKTIDLADNNVINQIPVTYEQLTALIAANDGAGALKKGNKYLITDFQETWTDGSEEVEQIIVTASSPNTLERVAASVTNPNDYIEYTKDSSGVYGDSKGRILKRINSHNDEYDYSRNNTIGEFSWGNKFGNNFANNTINYYCMRNEFEQDCISNSIEHGAECNKFGRNFSFNTANYQLKYNTFGSECTYNTFGNLCNSNTFGNSCSSNTIGNSCQFNTFGNGFSGNTLGTNFMYNVFGNFCYLNNITHSGNQYNNVGSNFHDNDFADSFYSNKIKDNFYNNDIDGSFEKNEIEDGCYHNHFQGSFINNKIGKGCTFCVFGSGYQYNIFDESIFINPVQFDDIYDWQVHLRASYTCKIYRNSNGVLTLEYENADGQTVRLTAE